MPLGLPVHLPSPLCAALSVRFAVNVLCDERWEKHIHLKKMCHFLKRALGLHLCTAQDDLRSYLCSFQVRSGVAVQTGHRNVQKDSSQEQEAQPLQGY
jgi:hypothetical protein